MIYLNNFAAFLSLGLFYQILQIIFLVRQKFRYVKNNLVYLLRRLWIIWAIFSAFLRYEVILLNFIASLFLSSLKVPMNLSTWNGFIINSKLQKFKLKEFTFIFLVILN